MDEKLLRKLIYSIKTELETIEEAYGKRLNYDSSDMLSKAIYKLSEIDELENIFK